MKKIPKKVWERSVQSLDDLKGKIYVQTGQGVRKVFIHRRFLLDDSYQNVKHYHTMDYKLTFLRRLNDGHLVCYAYSWSDRDLQRYHPIFKNYWLAYSYNLRITGGKS